jgi:hypothetical protein
VRILAVFPSQVALLRQLLRQGSSNNDSNSALATMLPSARVAVHTVDSFQGSEAKCIVLSLVRSNAQQRCGFLRDGRRLNVAMTRAKDLLVVLGDGATLTAAHEATTAGVPSSADAISCKSSHSSGSRPNDGSSSSSSNAAGDWYLDCCARGVVVAFPGQAAFEAALLDATEGVGPSGLAAWRYPPLAFPMPAAFSADSAVARLAWAEVAVCGKGVSSSSSSSSSISSSSSSSDSSDSSDSDSSDSDSSDSDSSDDEGGANSDGSESKEAANLVSFYAAATPHDAEWDWWEDLGGGDDDCASTDVGAAAMNHQVFDEDAFAAARQQALALASASHAAREQAYGTATDGSAKDGAANSTAKVGAAKDGATKDGVANGDAALDVAASEAANALETGFGGKGNRRATLASALSSGCAAEIRVEDCTGVTAAHAEQAKRRTQHEAKGQGVVPKQTSIRAAHDTKFEEQRAVDEKLLSGGMDECKGEVQCADTAPPGKGRKRPRPSSGPPTAGAFAAPASEAAAAAAAAAARTWTRRRLAWRGPAFAVGNRRLLFAKS